MAFYEYVCECGEKKDIATDKFETREETKERTGGIICKCGKEMLRLVSNFTWKFANWTSQTKVEFEKSTVEDSMKSFQND